jgi:hypothetical protein
VRILVARRVWRRRTPLSAEETSALGSALTDASGPKESIIRQQTADAADGSDRDRNWRPSEHPPGKSSQQFPSA